MPSVLYNISVEATGLDTLILLDKPKEFSHSHMVEASLGSIIEKFVIQAVCTASTLEVRRVVTTVMALIVRRVVTRKLVTFREVGLSIIWVITNAFDCIS